tara:strand:+ start:989 stop:1681 length:693 start_codon:yes stop_codon:yes gene_type:complete
MKKNNNYYDNKVVYKPWGYEYTIYRNSNRLAITLVNINYNQKTSLHCHPKKKTGFIIVSGQALVQLGVYDSNVASYKAPSRLVIRPGLFHSIKALSKKGVCALEFETPVNKKDLVRFKDQYGRQSKPYEGSKYTKKIGSKLMKFKKPRIGKNQKYTINNLEISLEVHNELKNSIKKNDRSISAILNGKIVDKNRQNVISHGEIVKTTTLKKLCETFKIDKQLTILRVSKK